MPIGVYVRSKENKIALSIAAKRRFRTRPQDCRASSIRLKRLWRTEKFRRAHSIWSSKRAIDKRKNGYCDICKKHCKIHKDHNHKNGKNRGGLCFKCNVGIGLFSDNPKLLNKAIKYLKKWEKQ